LDTAWKNASRRLLKFNTKAKIVYLVLGAPFRIKNSDSGRGLGVYGSIPRLRFEFPLDSLGLLYNLI